MKIESFQKQQRLYTEPDTYVVDWPEDFTLKQFLEQEDLQDALPDQPENLLVQQQLDSFLTNAIKLNQYQKDALVDQDTIELVIHQKVDDSEIQQIIGTNNVETQDITNSEDEIITENTKSINTPKFQQSQRKNMKKQLELQIDQNQEQQESDQENTQVTSTPRLNTQTDVKSRFSAKLSNLEKALSTIQSTTSVYQAQALTYEEKTFNKDYQNVVPFVDRSEQEERSLIQEYLEDSCPEFKYHVVEVVAVETLQQIDNLFCVRQSLGLLPEQEQLIDDCCDYYQIAIVRNAYGAYVIIYFQYDKKFNITIKAIYPICSRAMIQVIDETNVPPEYRVLPITQSDADIESSRIENSDYQSTLYNRDTEDEQRFILTIDGYSQLLQMNNGQASRLSHALQIAVSELTGPYDYSKQIELRMLSIHFFLKLCKCFDIDTNDICQIAQSTINEEYTLFTDLIDDDIEKWYQSLLGLHYSLICMDFYQDNFDCINRKLKRATSSNIKNIILLLEQFIICPMIIGQDENIINLTSFDKNVENLSNKEESELNDEQIYQLSQLSQALHALQKNQQLLKSGDRQMKPLPIELLYSDLSGTQNQNFQSKGQFEVILLSGNDISKKAICDTSNVENYIFSDIFSNFLYVLPTIINNKLNIDKLPQFLKTVVKEVRNVCSENEVKLTKVYTKILNVDQNLLNDGINPSGTYAFICIGKQPVDWKEKLQKYQHSEDLEEWLEQSQQKWNETAKTDFKQAQHPYKYTLALLKCENNHISIAVNKNTGLPPMISYEKQLKVYEYNTSFSDVKLWEYAHRDVIVVNQKQFIVRLDDTFDISDLKQVGLIYLPLDQAILREAIKFGNNDVVQKYINSLSYLEIVDTEEQEDAAERQPEFNQVDEFSPEFTDMKDKFMEYMLSLNWYQMILQHAQDSKNFYTSSYLSSIVTASNIYNQQQENNHTDSQNDFIGFYTEQWINKQNDYINYQGRIEQPNMEEISINCTLLPEDAIQTLFKEDDEFGKLKKKQQKIIQEIQQHKQEKKVYQMNDQLQQINKFIIDIFDKVCQVEIQKKSKLDNYKKKYNQKIEQSQQVLNYWLQHNIEDDLIQLKNSKQNKQSNKISAAINRVINHNIISDQIATQFNKSIEYYEIQDMIGGFDFEDSQARQNQNTQQYINNGMQYPSQQSNNSWWLNIM